MERRPLRRHWDCLPLLCPGGRKPPLRPSGQKQPAGQNLPSWCALQPSLPRWDSKQGRHDTPAVACCPMRNFPKFSEIFEFFDFLIPSDPRRESVVITVGTAISARNQKQIVGCASLGMTFHPSERSVRTQI